MPLQRRPRITKARTDEKPVDAGKRKNQRMIPEPSLAALNDLKKLESLRVIATYNIPDDENSANDDETRPVSARRTPRSGVDQLRSLYDGSATWSRPNTSGSIRRNPKLEASQTLSLNSTTFSLEFPLGLDSDAQLAQSVMAGLLEEKTQDHQTSNCVLLERKVLSGAERSVTSPRGEDHPGGASPKEKAPGEQGGSRRPSQAGIDGGTKDVTEEASEDAPKIKVVKAQKGKEES